MAAPENGLERSLVCLYHAFDEAREAYTAARQRIEPARGGVRGWRGRRGMMRSLDFDCASSYGHSASRVNDTLAAKQDVRQAGGTPS
jgi:hypothetical protein